MPLSSGTLSKDNILVFEPEIWSGAINDFYRAKLVTGNFFWDLSSALTGGGDQINIPNVTEMTANDKTNGAEVTLNNWSDTDETDVNLVVDTWKEVSFLIEDFEAKQVATVYDLQEKYAKNAAYTAAASLEDALITLFTGFSQTIGDSASEVADSNIRRAIQYLDDADAPQEDRAFFFSPAVMWDDIMAIDKFVLANESGGRGPVTSGPVGLLYGYPLFVSSRVTNLQNCYAHKDALVFASSPVRVQSEYQQQRLGTLVTADVMFGVLENRDTSGVNIIAAA